MKKLLIVLLLVTGVEICSAQSITTYSQIPEYCGSGISNRTREQNIACLRAMAANDGGSGPVKPNWHDKIIKKTRPNLVFNADNFKGDKQTIIQVTLAPDGIILSRTLTTSSGDANWDQAVLSAIDNMQTFPKDDNGQIPIYDVTLKFKPR